MSTLAAASLPLPLADEQLQRVNDAVAGLTPAQLQWVSGYVAGLGVRHFAPLEELLDTLREEGGEFHACSPFMEARNIPGTGKAAMPCWPS